MRLFEFTNASGPGIGGQAVEIPTLYVNCEEVESIATGDNGAMLTLISGHRYVVQLADAQSFARVFHGDRERGRNRERGR